MIPELLQKQNRALSLEAALMNGIVLSVAESVELDALRAFFEKATSTSIKNNLSVCRKIDAHKKRTKGLSVGTYAAAA